jgi:hypothetical protein
VKYILERETMSNSHCLMLLSMVFPLHSISAQASSCNGDPSLIQTGRGIDAWQVDSNVEDLAPQVQSSNREVTMDLRSRKGHRSMWHRHRHLKNVRSVVISFLKYQFSLGAIPKLFHYGSGSVAIGWLYTRIAVNSNS